MKKLVIGIILALACIAGTFYFSPSLLIASVQFTERQLAGLSTRTATVDGLTLHYYDGGPTNGETLLMIHGFGANRDNWLRLARHFTDRYRVIALDLPGFGDSSKPDASYDVATQTKRLHAFIDALKIDKPHLIGNSMGGHIAALYAAHYPDQLSSVALVDNAGITSPRMSEMFQMIERGQPNPLVVRKPEDFSRLMDFVFVSPPPLPDSLKRHFAEQSMANQAHYDMIFAQLREQYVPLEPELPKIEVPVLVLWGDKDRVLDVSSIEVMKPLLKKSTVIVMRDCGHAPMIERPEETAQHYQAFLDSL